MKKKYIKPEDIAGDYALNVSLEKSIPACMDCLPPAPLSGHKSIHGMMIHTRIDIPDGILYILNEPDLKKTKSKR